MSSYCLWISVDPVRCKVDVYPKPIAIKIEKAYKERNTLNSNKLVLGNDFFNSTIHFDSSGLCYQTTPGIYMGRNGFKQPGYRSVQRLNINLTDEYFDIYSKQVNGEWRICNYSDSNITFHEKIDKNCLIETDILNDIYLKEWEPEHLNIENPTDLNNFIILWEWCRGIPEKQGNLLHLDDKWWCPYLYEQNKIIENAFKEKNNNINITLPFDNSIRRIQFNNDTCFGNQYDDINNKTRMIRRKIITISQLQELIKNMNVASNDPYDILQYVEDDNTPKEFICCITQTIMVDPVKTVDGQTYDKDAILKWFEEHSTSPLTGLILSSKNLVSNIELKEKIMQYVSFKSNNIIN